MRQAPFITQKRTEWQEGPSAECIKGQLSHLQSGLPEEWWDLAVECYCYLRNVHDKIADGKTASE